MSSYWLNDYELFLYAKGPDDVHLWRCKKPASSSSLIVPMERDDFDYVSNVKNHQELIDDLFNWDESDFKRLVKYIYEKRLLVNGEGLVIAKLMQKADKDENKTIDDANEEDVPVTYIRSLDVLPLESYIPRLSVRQIPLRTVKYLGDANGKAAMMKEDSNVTKLIARIADLESDMATTTSNVADLQSKNKTLEAEIKKLTADLGTQMTALTALQQQVKNTNTNSKEVWMNDLTSSKWVGVEGLKILGPHDDLSIFNQKGIFTLDESTTNVRASYWYTVHLWANSGVYKIVSLEDLVPNKEKARFSQDTWYFLKSKGKAYVFRGFS